MLLQTRLPDAFVTAFNAAGSALVYSFYLGGKADDFGYGIDVDSAGNAYVVGRTASTDFPGVGPLQPAFAGGSGDTFVAKILAPVALTIAQVGNSKIGRAHV